MKATLLALRTFHNRNTGLIPLLEQQVSGQLVNGSVTSLIDIVSNQVEGW